MAHKHKCPECYEAYFCGMDCTIEPDLEDENSGEQYGSYCVCDDCKKGDGKPPEPQKITIEWFRSEAQKKSPSPQWWKLYNGIYK